LEEIVPFVGCYCIEAAEHAFGYLFLAPEFHAEENVKARFHLHKTNPLPILHPRCGARDCCLVLRSVQFCTFGHTCSSAGAEVIGVCEWDGGLRALEVGGGVAFPSSTRTADRKK